MIYLHLLNNSTTNGTVDAGVGDELMGMAYTEITLVFWAVISIVGVVGAIAIATSIPSMRASGIRLISASVMAGAMFYILPGIIEKIKMVYGW